MNDPNDVAHEDAADAAGDAAADHDAQLDEHEGRIAHLEDILDKIMTAGHVYARAGEDHAKLREHIAAR